MIRVNEETPGYPLMHDRKLMTATKAASDDTGLKVLDIEFVRISPDINVADLEPFISAGAELKAKYIITAPYDPDLGRLADRLAAFEDLAAPYGLHTVLEFFPWTVVPNFSTALSVVEATGQPGIGILVRCISIARTARSSSSRIRRRHACRLCMSLTRPYKRPTQWTNCSTPRERSVGLPGKAASTFEVFSNRCRRDCQLRSKCR